MDLSTRLISTNEKQKIERNKRRCERYAEVTEEERSQRRKKICEQRTRQKLDIVGCQQVNNGHISAYVFC